jgi:hypothetical protein
MSAELTPMSDAQDVQPVTTPEPVAPPVITTDGIDVAAQEAKKADNRPTPPHALERGRRHRVRDIATPADVPVIRDLSATIKELTPVNDEDRPRVAELRKKLRAALELDDAPVTPKVEAKPAERPLLPDVGDFNEPEPTIEQFADKDDPYGEQLKAWSRWDRKREAHEAKAAETKAQSEKFQRETVEQFNAKNAEYASHLTTFKASTPDYDAIMAQHASKGTPLLFHAILGLGQDGPKTTYDLMKHPTLLDELILLTDGKAITSDAVATTQRILKTRLATGSAGAVAPSVPIKVAPKPPSPARTGPMTPSEKLPGDDDPDLDHHRKAFGVGGRRHRGA